MKNFILPNFNKQRCSIFCLLPVLLSVLLTACAAAPAAAPTSNPSTPTTGSNSTAAADTPTTAPTLVPTQTTAALPTSTPTHSPSPTPTYPPALPFTWKGGQRPLLLAHYMPWYQTQSVDGSWGWHWTMNHFSPSHSADGAWQNLASHFTPLTGPYSSNDPAVIEYQVMLMKLSGIDGVIVDWYGSTPAMDYAAINTATGSLFKAVQKAGLKFVICYEDQTIQRMIDAGTIVTADAIKTGQASMRYLQDTWFQEDAYLKVDGKPLLLTFGPQYFKGPDRWNQVFSVLNPQPFFVTLDNPSVPEAAAAYAWPPMWASQAGVLTQATLKSYLDDFYSKTKEWKFTLGGAFPGFFDIYKQAGVGNSYGFLDAQLDRTFRYTLQTALDNQANMIQLATWNDYGEGTIIEPTVETGYIYLEGLQEFNRLTTGGKFTFTADDLRLPLRWYQLRVKNAGGQDVLEKLEQAFQAVANGDPAAAQGILHAFEQ